MNELEHYKALFGIAVQALVKIDDHFEYRNESEIDRIFVKQRLEEFNKGVSKETMKFNEAV